MPILGTIAERTSASSTPTAVDVACTTCPSATYRTGMTIPDLVDAAPCGAKYEVGGAVAIGAVLLRGFEWSRGYQASRRPFHRQSKTARRTSRGPVGCATSPWIGSHTRREPEIWL